MIKRHKWLQKHYEWLLEHKTVRREQCYKLFLEAFPDMDVSMNQFSIKRSQWKVACGGYNNYIWTEELDRELMELKDTPRNEAWEIFNSRHPGLTTFIGFANHRSRCGAVSKHIKHGCTKARPIYSFMYKKGYKFIKVAQPSVWWPYQKWIWIENNPDRLNELQDHDCFIFLDGDITNFSLDNIELMHRREQTMFQFFGGTVPGHPEETKIHLLQARLKIQAMDVAEKQGLVVYTGGYRVLKEERNEKVRTYYQRKKETDPEWKAKFNERQRQYKRDHPLTEEQKQKHREACKRYIQKKREAEKLGRT